ncbi:hypothetical protein [Parendozoicomonas haliclonae]|uniref:Uncharacterized protein n=1 Tax=Parendozoicomonas haliclonae TaxID=1960125 RepID=A0A1X7AKW3_9GAMM|nr:hypothetical protein [Parendozoicomonas haliclonae]SMA48421.1 hypothetical protein EHSB41UT_02733 [Parendozoicomonas haliclonae]
MANTSSNNKLTKVGTTLSTLLMLIATGFIALFLINSLSGWL